ncbi:MAG TPA: DinB family protein [Bryobacteraceae bacterium]|jgi:uncharacterized damage-inducible protein DinB
MDIELLRDLAQHQAWADEQHWKVLHENPRLLEDAEIRKRLNHMVTACEMLQTLARGEAPSVAGRKDRESMEELRTAMANAQDGLVKTIGSAVLEGLIALPRGPKGPFKAPAGVLLLQALLHNQHHRGQNAARMRALGVEPPMTDFVVWYAAERAGN